MYCKMCGKEIAEDQLLCEECKALVAKKDAGNRKTAKTFGTLGFVAGILSFVMMCVAAFLCGVVLGVEQAGGSVALFDLGAIDSAIIVIEVITVVLAVVGVVFGVLAIVSCKKVVENRPTKAMVFGIIGLAASALAVVNLLTLFIL